MKASKAIVMVTTSLPKNSKKSVTLSMTATLTQFLVIRLNASLADLQKFVPLIAVKIYAFLLMNFMNFSRHQRQHLHRHMTTFTGKMSAPFSFSLSSMYCTTFLIILIIAIIKDPKARVPVWYLYWDLKSYIFTWI